MRLDGDHWMEVGSVEVGSEDDSSIARVAPFDEVELEVGRLFPPHAPATG